MKWHQLWTWEAALVLVSITATAVIEINVNKSNKNKNEWISLITDYFIEAITFSAVGGDDNVQVPQ